MTDDTQQPESHDDNSSKDDMQALQARLERGAEPYWMQDIRCAQRAIEAERARLRAASEPRAQPEEED
jgi:hypothetical protein